MDVRRQIERGLSHGASAGPPAGSTTPTAAAVPSTDTATVVPAPAADPARLQEQLAALWESARTLAAPADDDAAAAADQAAERAAIEWEGSQHWTPEKLATFDAAAGPTGAAADVQTPQQPIPPAGAKLYFEDAAGRRCAAASAARWTWEGASAWFSAAEYPVPIGRKGDR
jgi:hypothetical protein